MKYNEDDNKSGLCAQIRASSLAGGMPVDVYKRQAAMRSSRATAVRWPASLPGIVICPVSSAI